MVQVFVDGRLVGQQDLPAAMPRPITTGNITIPMPDVARMPGDHVIAVMVRNNGHNWDLTAMDEHKEGRGLIAASLEPLTGPAFAVPLNWRIQGRSGGENFTDRARGTPNNGGQYGERMGWHLPAFDDRAWRATGAHCRKGRRAPIGIARKSRSTFRAVRTPRSASPLATRPSRVHRPNIAR
jgi:beta-galactosidase GanA